jgi:hypothetical protein
MHRIMGVGMRSAYGGRHKEDSAADQFRMPQTGHCSPAAQELVAIKAIPFAELRRQYKGSGGHSGNSPLQAITGHLLLSFLAKAVAFISCCAAGPDR